MAQVLQENSPQGAIDVGEWKNSSAKGGDGIPPLGSHTYTCNCRYCKAILKETEGWTKATKDGINIAIKIGDRVLIHGSLPGVVKYIGDLDSNYTNDQIYIGVKLDDPVGDHDGVFKNKRFFECPNLHGVIVPIEEVNILVPCDGRTITVSKDPANRFYSMPEFADLDSIASSTGDSNATFQTMSEGRLTTPLPEYNFQTSVTAPSSDMVGPVREEMCSLSDDEEEVHPKKLHDKLLKEDGVTRSSVFICDQPGSIAARIASSQSANSIKERLLHSLSCHCSTARDVTIEDLCGSEEELNMAKTAEDSGTQAAEDVSTKSHLPSKTSGQAVIPSSPTVHATPAPSAVPLKGILHIKKPVKSANSSSTSAVNTKPSVAKTKMIGSKSAACPTSLKKNETAPPPLSKLATNKVTAPATKNTSPTKSNSNKKSFDKKPSKTEEDKIGNQQTQGDETRVVDIEEEDELLKEATIADAMENGEVDSPTVVPKLVLVEDKNEDGESLETDVEQTISYTGRLLSSLPMEDAVTPLSNTTKMDDTIDFDEWAEKWGSGAKGWAQARTLQKLKEAQRKGMKEVEWQKAIDELEKDEEYAPRVRSIKNLREEITNVRKRNAEFETVVQEHKALLHSSDLRKELEELEEQTKAMRQANDALLKQVVGHPFFDLVREAVEYLRLEEKVVGELPSQ